MKNKGRILIYVLIGIAVISLSYMMKKRLCDHPTDDTLDADDWFWNSDNCLTDKRMAGEVFMDYIYNTADTVRGELVDTASQLRSEIGGGTGWSVSGDYLYTTDLTDSVGIQTSSPTKPLDVSGDGRFDGDLAVTDNAIIGDSAIIGDTYQDAFIYWADGTGLTFDDAFNDATSLNDLITSIGSPGSLLYSSGGQLHVGGVASANTNMNMTGYQLDIYNTNGSELYFGLGGDTKLTGISVDMVIGSGTHLDEGIVVETDGHAYMNVDMVHIRDTLVFKRSDTEYTVLRDATGFRFDNPSTFRIDSAEDGNHLHGFVSMQFTPSAGAPSSPLYEGKLYYDETDSVFKYYTGYTWYDVGTGAGSGDVSVSGTPVNNQVAIWTDASTIEGDADLTFDGDTLTIATCMKYKTDLANNGDTCWPAMLPNLGTGYGWEFDSAETDISSWASYLDSIGEFDDFITNRDLETGEWNWQRRFGDSYHKLNATKAPQQLQIAIEKNFVWDKQMRDKLDSLEKMYQKPREVTIKYEPKQWATPTVKLILCLLALFVLGLLGWNINQQRQINKLIKFNKSTNETLHSHKSDVTMHR